MSKQIKTILITGATAGIGRHAAIELASRGHHVIASGRRESALDELREQAQRQGWRLDGLKLDVTKAQSIAQLRASVLELTDGDGIDVLVNNAGYGLWAPLAEVTDADLRAQFDTNVFGLMAVTRAFLPEMVARGDARILNVSSVAGRTTFPMMGAYHASKYAVEALSDALRYELAPLGVKVVLIEPGPIHTEFVQQMHNAGNPYRRDDSVYAPMFAQADWIEDRTMATAGGPAAVTRAIVRGIQARRPRARYVAPFSSRLGLALLDLLPTSLKDAILRAVFGLSRRRLLGDGERPLLGAG
jgi:NAD(P)-dependent dehydrogenase (short-subunit alcohol dehydrogenase family)